LGDLLMVAGYLARAERLLAKTCEGTDVQDEAPTDLSALTPDELEVLDAWLASEGAP
jgi:hypothetical protein